MVDTDSIPNPSGRFRLAQAIRLLDGRPFWWREEFDAIAAGIESGKVGRRESVHQLQDVLRIARSAQQIAQTLFKDPAVQDGLHRHYELAVEEAHEFAEQHGLALSPAPRTPSSTGRPDKPR